MSLSQMLWFGSALTTFVIAVFYGIIAAYTWFRSRFVFGPTSQDDRKTMRRLLDISSQGKSLILTRLTLFYGGLGLFVVAIAAREWLGIIVAIVPFVLIAWMEIRTTTLPIVLVLGTSTHSSILRQRTIKYRLSPLRVVSLLDVDVPWDTSLANEMTLDCFRTTNEDDWWLVITRMMEIAPILVIDTAAETHGVHTECQHILKTGLWRKCLFLTPPDGSAPILDHLLPIPGVERSDLKIVRYEDVPQVIALMASELRQRRD